MQRTVVAFLLATCISVLVSASWARDGTPAAPYKLLRTAQVGGDGSFDYINADVIGRRLYTPRNGPEGHLAVFNLDTLAPVGVIDGIKAGGAAVDPKSHHGFSTTKPITMWDSETLKVIKTIDVDGRPDGIEFDPYNARVWVLSHMAPYVTVIDAKEGTVIGTVDIGGAPEQGVSDGKGTFYVNVSDKANIAVINAKTLAVKTHYDLSSKGSGGSGLALDAKHHILFAYYRMPSPEVVIVNALTGTIIATLPTGAGVDTVVFNPATKEAISGGSSGSMTFIRENSPTRFTVEQTLVTKMGAKTLTLDPKTNRVLTMTADFEPAALGTPPAPAGRPPPRGPMVPGSFSILLVGR